MRTITDLPSKIRLTLAGTSLIALFLFVWRVAFSEVSYSTAALFLLGVAGVVLLALLVGIAFARLNQFILRNGGTDTDWLVFPNEPSGLQKLRSELNARPTEVGRGISTVNVRQAVLADLEALADLFDQYRQFQGKPGDLSACLAFLHERFNHGESVLFLATSDGHPVGFAQLYPSFSSVELTRVFTLNDLFVVQAGRRVGVASALLRVVEQYAWSCGACRVSLNVVQQNVSAQALYQATGWLRDDQFQMYHRYPPNA
jgi:GNAT superfamily N-acetyltransferase